MSAGAHALIRAALAVTLATAAPGGFAYVGPGAGLSLLGALVGLVAAVVAAVGAIVLYPLRRARRRAKERADAAGGKSDQDAAAG